MNVGDVCNRDIVRVPPEASLADATRQMRDRHVGMVVITKNPLDEPVAIGVLTDRDVAFAALAGHDLAATRVAQCLSKDPLVLNEDTNAARALERMRERNVRRVPVVDSHGTLVGVVSTDDLLAGIAGELSKLAELVQYQPQREPQR
jgi:CBS domain-containing protein